jgi:hypothetical protein
MTKPKLILLAAGIAAGYVLGTRAGREQYDAMKATAQKLWENPRVSKARKDVEAYARAQAPIIRERAGAAAKAAPEVAKSVAARTATAAKDVAGKATATAKDVTGKATATAKDVTDRAASTAKDVQKKATATAKDVRDQAGKVAGDLRERGEAAVDSAVTSAGKAREDALDPLDDEDDRAAD